VTDTAVITLVLAAAIALFLVREGQIAGGVDAAAFPLDDSFIHLHFARNVAEGQGFSYNPGHPVSGSTAPLWTLLLAAGFAVLGDRLLWVKALGIAGTLATALLARWLGALWTGSRGWGLVAGTATAMAGPLVWGALSGMEVSLAAMLVTASIVAETRGRPVAAALGIALATLARPEAVVCMPLLWLAGPITLVRTAAYGGILAAVVAPWVLFNLATTGTPLPATAAAKIEGGIVARLAGTREGVTTTLVTRPWRFEVEWVTWLTSVSWLLAALVLLGLGRLTWRRKRVTAIAAALAIHPIAMAVLAPYRGPGFQEGRYSIHLLPLAVTTAVVGLAGWPWQRESLVSRPSAGERWRRWAVGTVFLASFALALWPAASRYGWAVQNISGMQVRLGRWVHEHVPREARLAVNDVGAIAYLSRREIVDVMGLVTPAVIPYRREGEAGIRRFLERQCPDYLIIFPEWFPGLSAASELFSPIHRVRLEHNTVVGADEMVVYETVWNRRGRARPCGSRARGPGDALNG
jgi:hypothetical protein